MADTHIARKRMSNLAKEFSIEDQTSSLRTLRTLGFVEDFGHDLRKRFGMLYRLPKDLQASSDVQSLHAFFPKDSDTGSVFEPLLGERFELARLLAVSLYEFHALGWLHKEINSDNIVFFSSKNNEMVSLQSPYLVGFGYARPDEPDAKSLLRSKQAQDLYQHPDLRKETRSNQDDTKIRYENKHDIYSLGLVLLEIGLWDSISVFQTENTMEPEAFKERLLRVCRRDLGHRMGANYTNVVMKCIKGIPDEQNDEELETGSKRSNELMSMYWHVVKELSKCHCR
jgi:serine/threonine protein kinase